jgi:NAD(P)-dependent dehydrogenase (short-subunit alcohol dehydrogenase family)
MAVTNRVALITGGSRGIGRGIGLRLAKEGARIAISYLSNKAAAQQSLRQLQALGADCVAVETDVTDPTKAEQLVNTVAERYGRIDILVNNVGGFRWGALAESSLDEWQSIFDSNLRSVLYVSRAALSHMRRGRWGRIVNMGAVGAERAFGQAKISAYAAGKAAVVAFSRSLALEEAKHGITVNVVNPPSIDEKELTLDEARRIRDARFPIGRPPTVEDVAAAVAFFASDEAEYITGQVVNVSGGWML